MSALTGEGIAELVQGLETRLSQGHRELSLSVPAEDGAGLAWLYGQVEVLQRKTTRAGNAKMLIRVAPERLDKVMALRPAFFACVSTWR